MMIRRKNGMTVVLSVQMDVDKRYHLLFALQIAILAVSALILLYCKIQTTNFQNASYRWIVQVVEVQVRTNLVTLKHA